MATELNPIVPPPFKERFKTARAQLCHDDVAAALPLLEEIERALPDNEEVHLYASWARARSAEHLSDRDQQALEVAAKHALASHVALGLPLCILGYAALRRDDLHVASRLFAHAADAEPSLVDARRGARLVEQRLAHPARVDERNMLSIQMALAVFVLVVGLVMIMTPFTESWG